MWRMLMSELVILIIDIPGVQAWGKGEGNWSAMIWIWDFLVITKIFYYLICATK